MAEIGAYDAKTHLPKLLERVERGESFIITRHGRPVAALTPVSGRDVARVQAAMSEIHAIRKALKRRGVRLQEVFGPVEPLRDATQRYIVALGNIPIDIDAGAQLSDILQLAQQCQLTSHDAAYLELAQRRNASLATFDRALRIACLALKIPILP